MEEALPILINLLNDSLAKTRVNSTGNSPQHIHTLITFCLILISYIYSRVCSCDRQPGALQVLGPDGVAEAAAEAARHRVPRHTVERARERSQCAQYVLQA